MEQQEISGCLFHTRPLWNNAPTPTFVWVADSEALFWVSVGYFGWVGVDGALFLVSGGVWGINFGWVGVSGVGGIALIWVVGGVCEQGERGWMEVSGVGAQCLIMPFMHTQEELSE